MSQEILRDVEKKTFTEQKAKFGPGDTVRVHVRIKEGNKERIQAFKGDVIQCRGAGAGATFTVRRTNAGVGVERIFPLHSPVLSKIDVLRRGKVRRAKLYYLRERTGRSARIKEKDRK